MSCIYNIFILFLYSISMMAGVAQLVEHQIVALVVAGSSPVARPQKKDIQFDLDILFFILYLSKSLCSKK